SMNSASRAPIRLPGSGLVLSFLARAIIAPPRVAPAGGRWAWAWVRLRREFAEHRWFRPYLCVFRSSPEKGLLPLWLLGIRYLRHPQTSPGPGPDSTLTAGLRTQTPPP